MFIVRSYHIHKCQFKPESNQVVTGDFNPLPAAACLLDPSLAAVLMEPDQAALLCAAKKYVIKQSECPQVSVEPVAADRYQSHPRQLSADFDFWHLR